MNSNYDFSSPTGCFGSRCTASLLFWAFLWLSCTESAFSKDDGVDIIGDLVSRATTCQTKNDFQNSTALREEFLSKTFTNPNSQIRLWALLENGRDYTKWGKYKQAVQSYDQLLYEYPDYGLEDGRRINILYEKVSAEGYDRHSKNRMVALAAIWERPEFKDKPQIWNVGRQIVAICHFSNDGSNLLRYGNELLARLRIMYDQYDEATKEKYKITNSYGEGLIHLADYYIVWGDTHNALLLYQELLRVMPDSQFAEYAKQMIAKFERQKDEFDKNILRLDLDTTDIVNRVKQGYALDGAKPPTDTSRKEINNHTASSEIKIEKNKDSELNVQPLSKVGFRRVIYLIGSIIILTGIGWCYGSIKRGRSKN